MQTWRLKPIKLHGVAREGRDTVGSQFREAYFALEQLALVASGTKEGRSAAGPVRRVVRCRLRTNNCLVVSIFPASTVTPHTTMMVD